MSNETDFHPGYGTCDNVSDICPVEATLYGDYFTTAACVGFSFAFGTLLLTQAFFAGKGTSWSYTICFGIGTLFELLGYIARTVMSYNPWMFEAFLVQNLTLVLAPTFIAAATSVTFKFLVLWHGAGWSIIRPGLLPYIFVGSDFVSIMIQSAGGGLAAMSTGPEDQDLAKVASTMLSAGVIFQVINMVACGGVMVLFVLRRRKGKKAGLDKINSSTTRLWDQGVLTPKSERSPPQMPAHAAGKQLEQKRVQRFIYALSVAYVAILVRCIYRYVAHYTPARGPRLTESCTEFPSRPWAMAAIYRRTRHCSWFSMAA